MTNDEIKQLIEAIKPKQQIDDFKRWLLPVTVGCTIAFVGWFANKSSRDIENVTTINKTLEFMQAQQNTTNEALKDQINDLKKSLDKTVEGIQGKLDEPRFTREDFNREMLYRDQDSRRIQSQLEEVLDKLNSKSK